MKTREENADQVYSYNEISNAMIKEIQMEAVFIGEKNVITKNVNLSKTWPLFTLILPKYVNISPFYKYKWKNADNFFKEFAFLKHAQIAVASLTYLYSTPV